MFLADLGAVQLSLGVLWRGALWRAVLLVISGVIFDLVAGECRFGLVWALEWLCWA